MNRSRFGLLDTVESIPLETKKRLKKKYENDNGGSGNDKKNNEKYIETTYSELKSLRDEGKLIPGSMYRITDYKCTTAQENTRSAGHQFDIIVILLQIQHSLFSHIPDHVRHNGISSQSCTITPLGKDVLSRRQIVFQCRIRVITAIRLHTTECRQHGQVSLDYIDVMLIWRLSPPRLILESFQL